MTLGDRNQRTHDFGLEFGRDIAELAARLVIERLGDRERLEPPVGIRPAERREHLTRAFERELADELAQLRPRFDIRADLQQVELVRDTLDHRADRSR